MPYESPWPALDIPKCNILSYVLPRERTPSDTAIWIDAANPKNSLSPAQALSYVKRFAVGLERLGVPEAAAIMVFTPNHIFMPVVYLAAAGSGRCFTGANPVYTTTEVAHQMSAVEAAVVLVHPSLLETGKTAAKMANIPLDRLFLFSATENQTTQGFRDWHSILVSEEDAEHWQWNALEGELAVNTTAVINFSSGTTGMPKGVCITHHNLVANSAQAIYNAYAGPHPKKHDRERWLAFLPLYHAYSQLFTINIALKLQHTTYVMSKFVFEDFLRYIQKFKITELHAVPPVLIMMAKRPETSKYDLSSVKHVISGAAPLSSEIQNEVMNRHGMIVCQGMGMTETTCSAFLNPGLTKDFTGSIGYLLPNTEARLVDEEGKDVRSGEAGELWLRGPQMMLEYWRNKKATEETLTPDKWLKTGDVATTRDEKWWIVDRKKELIKVNGLQVAPAELEAVLLKHQNVADAATVGITVHGEELPRAYIVTQDGSTSEATARDIQSFVMGKLARHKHLTGGIKFVDQIPRSASGKILRVVIKGWAKTDAKELEINTKPRL